MAAEYPYVLTPDAFRDFVTKLKTVGVPDKVNKQFIASLGFKSSNHQKFPGVLKFVGLVDSAGKPTQEYRAALRDPKSGPGALAGYMGNLFDNKKTRFEMNMDTLNVARRKDSHTKPVTSLELEEFQNSYTWLLQRLNKVEAIT